MNERFLSQVRRTHSSAALRMRLSCDPQIPGNDAGGISVFCLRKRREGRLSIGDRRASPQRIALLTGELFYTRRAFRGGLVEDAKAWEQNIWPADFCGNPFGDSDPGAGRRKGQRTGFHLLLGRRTAAEDTSGPV